MRVLWLTALVVVIDQATKQLVLRTMYLGQQIPILGDWLKFTYTENPGMAFGITFGPKAMVTVFAIIATVLISFYLYRVRRDYYPYRASLALILGGALGNIIDRVFYGKLYDNESLLVGKVVDFIHVNVWSGFIPEAVPLIGGTYVSLFPIWNVADMAIVCGVVGIVAFQKVHHRRLEERAAAQAAAERASDDQPAAPGPEPAPGEKGAASNPVAESAPPDPARRPPSDPGRRPPPDPGRRPPPDPGRNPPPDLGRKPPRPIADEDADRTHGSSSEAEKEQSARSSSREHPPG